MDKIGGLSLKTIPGLVEGTYYVFLKKVLRPEGLNGFTVGLFHILLAAGAVYLLFTRIKSLSGRVLVILTVLLMPLATNFVYILTGGVTHTLMYFSLIILYAGVMMAQESGASEDPDAGHPRLNRIVSAVMSVLMLFVVWSNVVYSNQVYLRKSLEEQATLSVMTRVIDRIEQVDGYEPGKTEVVFVGNLGKSDVRQNRRGYFGRHVLGDYVNFSVTYHETLSDYFKYYLAYPIIVADRDMAVSVSQKSEVAEMPAFPSAGCARMVDGRLVVKLSRDMDIMGSEEFHSSPNAD